jgi:predicted ATPase
MRTYEVLVATYRDCGYTLLELPRVDVAQRAAFVLAAIGAGPPPASGMP